jgi:hypothetical protein
MPRPQHVRSAASSRGYISRRKISFSGNVTSNAAVRTRSAPQDPGLPPAVTSAVGVNTEGPWQFPKIPWPVGHISDHYYTPVVSELTDRQPYTNASM